MMVHFGFHEWNSSGPTIGSLGNYDGVHLGHQTILNEVVARSRSLSAASVAVTFDPVPKKILQPERAPALIQTLEQRLEKIDGLGVEHTIVIRFDHAFAAMSPEDFVLNLLVRRLHIKGFVVGENFSFGHQKRGSIVLLREIGARYGFFVEAIPEVRVDGIRVSSTRIRQMISEGEIQKANELLGSAFTLSGTVVEGERLGGKLGIPTANLKVENETIPPHGVYIGRTLFSQDAVPSVINVGVRPTVGGKQLTVESHLLDFSGNLYGRKIELEFLCRIRDEKRFADVDQLKNQIYADIKQAKEYFVQSGGQS